MNDVSKKRYNTIKWKFESKEDKLRDKIENSEKSLAKENKMTTSQV